MRWTWCVVLASAVGCDSGVPDCKQAVDKAEAAIGGDHAVIANVIIGKCEKEKWSADVRTCLARVKNEEDAAACMSTKREAEERARAAVAEQQAVEARKEGWAAKDELELVEKELRTLDEQVQNAISAVGGAPSNADRVVAKAKLVQLLKAQNDVKARIAAFKAAAERAERTKGVHISKQCLDNPLAKGCQ